MSSTTGAEQAIIEFGTEREFLMAVMEVSVDLRSERAMPGEPLRVRPARAPRARGHGRRGASAPWLSARNGTAPSASKRSGSAPDRVVSRELLYEYHRHGDLGAREQLIHQYLPLVRKLARSFAGRGEQYDDLVQVGSIGLINAIDRFELDRGVDLTAYAIPNIVGEIKRHLRDRASPIRIPRRLQELNVSLRARAAELEAELERPATVTELARKAGVRQDKVAEALVAVSHQAVSLSGGVNGNGDGGLLERNGTPESGYEAGEDRAVLAKGFRILDQRERRLLHLGYFRGMSQAEIAREVGISQIHVSRLTRRALEKLRAEIGPAREC